MSYHYSTDISINLPKPFHKHQPSDLNSALKVIEKLRADKERLKKALSETLQKRDALYSALITLHSEVASANQFSQQSPYEAVKEETAVLVSRTKHSKLAYSILKEELGCVSSLLQKSCKDFPVLKLIRFATRIVNEIAYSERATFERPSKILDLKLARAESQLLSVPMTNDSLLLNPLFK